MGTVIWLSFFIFALNCLVTVTKLDKKRKFRSHTD